MHPMPRGAIPAIGGGRNDSRAARQLVRSCTQYMMMPPHGPNTTLFTLLYLPLLCRCQLCAVCPSPPPLMHGRGEREGTPFPLTRCSLLLGQGGLINVGEALPGAIDGHLPPHADTIIAAGHGQQVSGGRPGHSP